MSAAVRTVLGAALVLAAAPATPQTVDEIVTRLVAARGGRQALASVKTLRMKGRAIAGPGREAIVTREIARPGRIRTEFVFQGTTGVYAWDGKKGWRVSPLDGVFEPAPLPDDAAALAAEQADIEGPLVDWKAKGNKVEVVGKADLPGGPAHELRVTTKSGAVRQVFVDAGTGLIAKTVTKRKFRGHEMEMEIAFSDYKETGGVRFPRTIEAGAKGRPQRLRIVVDEVEVNPKLDEARFAAPR